MFKKNTLSLTIAMLVSAGTTPSALAQADQSNAVVEEVIVTGIRGSLSKALDMKRDSTQVIDAIVAEDIGKFPDNNVIEALQHVPGVQVAVDVMGEAQQPVIRGSADIVTTINGQLVFTGNGRTAALQDIPATMVSSIEVFKSTSADMIEGGVGGAIEIKLRRPFDFDGSKISTAAKVSYNDQSEEFDPNLSGLISNRWDTSAGEFGALINVSYSENHYREEAVWGGGFFPYNPDGTRDADSDALYGYAPGSVLSTSPDTDYILMRDAAGAWDRYGLTKRPAINTSFQWRPSDELEAFAEASYQGYEGEGNMSFLFTRTDAAQRADTSYEFHPGTNVVRTAQTENAFLLTSTQAFEGSTDSFQFTTGIVWDPSESLNIKADVNYQDSKIKRTGQILDLTRNAPTLDVNFNQNGAVSLDYGSLDLTTSDGVVLGTYFDNWGDSSGDALAFKVDVDYLVEWGPIHQIEFGVRQSSRNSSNDSADYSVCNECWLISATEPSLDGMLASTTGDFFAGEVTFPRQWITPSVDWLLNPDNQNTLRELTGIGYTGRPAALETLFFDISEDTLATYVQANYEFALGSVEIDGLVGVRYVDTSSDLNANEQSFDADGNQVFTPISLSSSDDIFLPNLSARFKFTEDLALRINGSKTLTRPAFGDLNPAMTIRAPIAGQINQGTGSGGNPYLTPFVSMNMDIALEWYFGEDSNLTGTIFRRGFDETVIPSTRTIDRDGIPYVLTSPENAGESEYTGYEASFQYFPENLPSALDGLGTQISYTYIDGTLTDVETGVKSAVPNVSENSYSLALFYEKEVFSARLSYVYRDGYKSGDNFCCSMPTDIMAKDFGSTDVSFSYNVTNDITVTLDATNIFEDNFQDYFGDATLFNRDTVMFARVISLGIRADI